MRSVPTNLFARSVLLFVAMLLALPVQPVAAAGTDARWVEATGFAALRSPSDTETARRRALADALLAAALAGGAEVSGHTVVRMGTVISDTGMVRTTYRIIEHSVIEASLSNKTWRIRVRALVGPPPASQCAARQILPVTAYAAEIHAPPETPAWVVPMAQDLALHLVDTLDRHRFTKVVRATGQPRLAVYQTTLPDAFNYTALTTGIVRTRRGDWSFQPRISLSLEQGRAGGKRLRIDLETLIYRGQGGKPAARARITNSIVISASTPWRAWNELTRLKRSSMIRRLTKGVDAKLARLLDMLSCTPVSAVLYVKGGKITVPVGRAHGLRPGALAYTTDRSGSTQMLEIASLGKSSTVLRPLDVGQRASTFSGRTVQFMDTGQ